MPEEINTSLRLSSPGNICKIVIFISSVQSLSCVWLFMTPWTAAHQASLFNTNSQSLPKLMSTELWCRSTISSSVVPFSHLQSFPTSGSFLRSQFFASGGQSIGVCFGSPCSPRDSQESSSTPQLKSINSLAFSLLYGPTPQPYMTTGKNRSFD